MAATLATRKPIDEITVDDLAEFPIWEFCIDEEDVEGRDETWIRPLAARVIPRKAYSLSVAAEFTTVSDIPVDGFVGVTTADQVEISVAVLLIRGKYLVVPDEGDMRDEGEYGKRQRGAVSDALGTPDVFPLRYRLRVLIENEDAPREGVIA